MSIPNISKDPTHRANMIGMGLNPLNEADVKKYMSGKYRVNPQENIERLKGILGNDISKNLGSAHESEISIKDGPQPKSNFSSNPRDQIVESMNGYSAMSTPNQYWNQPTMQTPINIDGQNNPGELQSPQNKIESLGYSKTMKYLNSLIASLKKPSIQLRLEVYKSLQDVLQTEKNFQGKEQALNQYRLGCRKAETALYQKLTNGY